MSEIDTNQIRRIIAPVHTIEVVDHYALALCDEIDRLRATLIIIEDRCRLRDEALREAEGKIDYLEEYKKAADEGITALRPTVRAEALEDAAKIAEGKFYSAATGGSLAMSIGRDIAIDIRALASGGGQK